MGGSLEKEMATRSSILAWKIPWTRRLVGCSPWGRRRVRQDLVTQQHPQLYSLVMWPWTSFLNSLKHSYCHCKMKLYLNIFTGYLWGPSGRMHMKTLSELWSMRTWVYCCQSVLDCGQGLFSLSLVSQHVSFKGGVGGRNLFCYHMLKDGVWAWRLGVF